MKISNRHMALGYTWSNDQHEAVHLFSHDASKPFKPDSKHSQQCTPYAVDIIVGRYKGYITAKLGSEQ